MKHVSSPRILDAMENNFPDACQQIIGKLTSVKIFCCVKKYILFMETHLLNGFNFSNSESCIFFLGTANHNPVTVKCNALHCLDSTNWKI